MAVVRQDMKGLSRKMDKWAKLFPEEVLKTFGNIRTMLVTDIRGNYLSGQVLGVVSGDLRKSIRGLIKTRPPVSLGIGTDVYYGTIWYARGRDFLKPSIKKHRTRIKTMILDGIMASYPKGVV